MLLQKLSRQEPKLTPEGKAVLQGVIAKLNKTPQQEVEEYEHSTAPLFVQPEFQF